MKLFTALALIVVFVAAQILFLILLAQLVVFGLARFHVDSGLAGPAFMLIALESVIAAGVATGVRRSK